MASEPKLVVALEARFTKMERDLKKVGEIADREVAKIERRFATANTRISSSFAGLGGALSRSLGILGLGVGAAQLVRGVTDAAQQYVALQNALKVTGLEGAALEQVLNRLFQISLRQGTAVGPLATLYSRAALAQKELGASSADLLKFTEGVSTALRVAGSSTAAASGALLQLSQAIGGSVIQAQEFNSIIDGARPVLQAVAAGLKEAGGSVGKLRELVKEGEVSAQAFFQAFLRGLPIIESMASKTAPTVGQATERVSTAFTMLIGELDKTTGASKNAAKNLTGVAEAIQDIPQYINAAVSGLASLQSWLGKVASHPFWEKLARAAGVKFTVEEAEAAGIKLENIATAASRVSEAFEALGDKPAAPPKIDTVSIKDFPAEADKAKKASKSLLEAFKRLSEGYRENIAELGVEAEHIGKSTFERERAMAVLDLETAAKKSNTAAGLKNTEVTAAQRVKIDELATAYANAKVRVEELEKRQRELTEASDEFASVMADGFKQAIIEGRELNEVLKSLIDRLASKGIDKLFDLLLGGGGIFGSGGIFGALFGLPGKAEGGPVSAGRAYMVGERGPELFVPRQSGTIVPNATGTPGRQSGGPVEAGHLYQTHGLGSREFFVPRKDGEIVRADGDERREPGIDTRKFSVSRAIGELLRQLKQIRGIESVENPAPQTSTEIVRADDAPSRQSGGPVDAGRLYQTHGLGEREFFVPRTSGVITRGSGSGGGAGAAPVSIVVDLRGSNGSEELDRKVHSGVTQGLRQYDRQLLQRVSYRQRVA